MFEDRVQIPQQDRDSLRALLGADAPGHSADLYRVLPEILAAGDDTIRAIEARIDLALLTAAEGLIDSALYQVDELTKDARRVRDLVAARGGEDARSKTAEALVQRADSARDAIELAASHLT